MSIEIPLTACLIVNLLGLADAQLTVSGPLCSLSRIHMPEKSGLFCASAARLRTVQSAIIRRGCWGPGNGARRFRLWSFIIRSSVCEGLMNQFSDGCPASSVRFPKLLEY